MAPKSPHQSDSYTEIANASQTSGATHRKDAALKILAQTMKDGSARLVMDPRPSDPSHLNPQRLSGFGCDTVNRCAESGS